MSKELRSPNNIRVSKAEFSNSPKRSWNQNNYVKPTNNAGK